nr:MAG TPA: Complement C5-like protein [Caudoviricetes sp.]
MLIYQCFCTGGYCSTGDMLPLTLFDKLQIIYKILHQRQQ